MSPTSIQSGPSDLAYASASSGEALRFDHARGPDDLDLPSVPMGYPDKHGVARR